MPQITDPIIQSILIPWYVPRLYLKIFVILTWSFSTCENCIEPMGSHKSVMIYYFGVVVFSKCKSHVWSVSRYRTCNTTTFTQDYCHVYDYIWYLVGMSQRYSSNEFATFKTWFLMSTVQHPCVPKVTPDRDLRHIQRRASSDQQPLLMGLPRDIIYNYAHNIG